MARSLWSRYNRVYLGIGKITRKHETKPAMTQFKRIAGFFIATLLQLQLQLIAIDLQYTYFTVL